MRYFAFKCGSRIQSHVLVSDEQINSVLSVMSPLHTEAFASIQTYDGTGNIVSCPIYMDLDGETALQDARYVVYLIQECLDVIPRLWFSGNKGFHLVIPYEIQHPQAHLVVKNFVNDISGSVKSIDPKVYRTKSLWRIQNYRASVEGRYKVPISYEELMGLDLDQIIELSKTQRQPHRIPFDTQRLSENHLFEKHLNQSVEKLPDFKCSFEEAVNNLDEDMMPCLKTIFMTDPNPGERNYTVYILAKFFKSCAIQIDDALTMMFTQPHFSHEKARPEVVKVFKSVYRSADFPKVGCKSGQDADLLRKFCDPLCPFALDFSKVGFAR